MSFENKELHSIKTDKQALNFRSQHNKVCRYMYFLIAQQI